MPRDIAGTYTLPAGNPVISGTIISSSWANTTMEDMANAMTDSLSRSGSGGMLAPLYFANGSELNPSASFINGPTFGMWYDEINDKLGITGGGTGGILVDNAGATAIDVLTFTTTLNGITPTVFGYLSGVTSSIQDQLNSKQDAVSLTASRALESDGSGNIAVSAVTSSELAYLSGVTSAIQTQLNAKQATITGGATSIVSANLTASRALVSDGSGKVAVSAVTSTELGYLDGVTSAIQTQLNAKQATVTGAASTVVTSNLTASRALISGTGGKIEASSSITTTELGYLNGVTSAIQTQLNAKLTTTGADVKSGGSLRFNDSIILSFGTGADAEFFCNGSHFYLDLNAGIGNFYIRDGTTTRFTFDDAGSFTATGNVSAYSDKKLKSNITKIDNALGKVLHLNGYTFDRTDIETPRQTGVIAQEVQKVLPEAVTESEDGTLTVAYGNMVGLLIESIKELEARIAELEG